MRVSFNVSGSTAAFTTATQAALTTAVATIANLSSSAPASLALTAGPNEVALTLTLGTDSANAATDASHLLSAALFSAKQSTWLLRSAALFVHTLPVVETLTTQLVLPAPAPPIPAPLTPPTQSPLPLSREAGIAIGTVLLAAGGLGAALVCCFIVVFCRRIRRQKPSAAGGALTGSTTVKQHL